MATEILRPNAAGDETSIGEQRPPEGEHWDKVDEETPDDISSYLVSYSTTYERDLYNLPAHTGSGNINKIKIYFRCRLGWTFGTADFAKPSLKSNTAITDGTEVSGDLGAWIVYSEEWTTNPATEAAWTWDDIDALQIGVSLRCGEDYVEVSCTQVYVEVDYTSGQTHVGSAYLLGIGSLAATATVGAVHYGVASLSGIGILAASAAQTLIGKAILSGVGILAAFGRCTFEGASTLTGIGLLTAKGVRAFTTGAILSGIGILSIKGIIPYIFPAFSGAGTLIVKTIMTYGRILRISTSISSGQDLHLTSTITKPLSIRKSK